MICCANKILSRSNNISSRRNKLNKTRMFLPGLSNILIQETLILALRVSVNISLNDSHLCLLRFALLLYTVAPLAGKDINTFLAAIN